MKKILLALAATTMLSTLAVAGVPSADYSKVKGATPAAIAVNESVRQATYFMPPPIPCAEINTKTGLCRSLLVLDAGDGGGK